MARRSCWRAASRCAPRVDPKMQLHGAQGAGRRARALRRGAAAGAARCRSSISSARDWGLAARRTAGARRRRALAAGGRARRRPAIGARLGLHPRAENSGAARASDRETATLTRDGIKWTRRDQASRRPSRPATSSMSSRSTASPARSACGRLPEVNGAIVVMDPFTGRVLAMVGGFSHDQSRVQPRHPGAAPAGLVVQAVRLCDRARQRLHAVEHHRSTDRSRSIRGRRLGIWRPENYDGKVDRPAHAALRHPVLART